MLLSFLLITLIILLKKVQHVSWMKIHGLFALEIMVFSIGCVLTYYGELVFYFEGINWLLLAVIMFMLGDSSYLIVFRDRRKQVRSKVCRLPHISWSLLITFTILGLMSVLFQMIEYGVEFSVWTSFSSLQTASHAISIQRYSGRETVVSLIGQILNSFLYVLPLCAGYSFVYAKLKKQKAICLCSFIPPLLTMMLTSAKLAVVVFFILFFISYMISYAYCYGKEVKLNTKIVRISILILALGVVLVYLSFVLRIGSGEMNIATVIKTKILEYVFGHIQAFDNWFHCKQMGVSDLTFGGETFLSITSILGLMKKEQGIYGPISGSISNVYTQFRGLIQDFGSYFSLVIIFALGFISSYQYDTIMRKQEPHILTQVTFAMLCFYILYYIVSAWVYTSYIFAFFIFTFFLLNAFWIKPSNRR